jgi:hypothetical protein
MSFEPTKTNAAPLKKSNFTRYLLPLALLVAVIGGLAWVTQQLPKWNSTKAKVDAPTRVRPPLEFAGAMATWGAKPEPGEKPEPKEFEPTQKGHFDFPFKNDFKEDAEIVFLSSSCNCTSVLACALDADETKAVHAQFNDSPAVPITYLHEPNWIELASDVEWAKLPAAEQKKKSVLIKPGAGGVVRVQWAAGPHPGASLNVSPKIGFRTVGGNGVFLQSLFVPVVVSAPVRFQPQRVVAGSLSLGSSTTAEFYAYSSTRDQFDLKLTASATDSLFDIKTTPVQVGGIFSRCQCNDLVTALEAEKIKARLRSAKRVSVTIYESRDGKYLDLGSFHRRLAVKLDGLPAVGVTEPELMGRVHGDIIIGGADDLGRIRMKAFTRTDGTTRSLELATDASWKLETYHHEPAWLKVKLTRDKNQPDPKRAVWHLDVTVPENTRGVRSLDDPDAVVLRVAGPPERFVRIPIEGQMSGP